MKVVGSLMFPKVIWPWEPFAILCVQKLLLSCVVLSFFLKSSDPERHFVHAPLISLQSVSFYSLGFLQVTWLWEAFATLFAFKLLLSCVIPSCFLNSPDTTTWVSKQYTSAMLLLTLHSMSSYLRRARSAFCFIQHKSGYNPDMKRKTGNPAALCSGYWSEDFKKLQYLGTHAKL